MHSEVLLWVDKDIPETCFHPLVMMTVNMSLTWLVHVGDQTQVFRLVQLALYQVSHLPSSAKDISRIQIDSLRKAWQWTISVSHRNSSRDWGDAQWVKHEDLSSNPQDPCETRPSSPGVYSQGPTVRWELVRGHFPEACRPDSSGICSGNSKDTLGQIRQKARTDIRPVLRPPQVPWHTYLHLHMQLF